MGRHRIFVVDDYSKNFFDELAKYGEVVKTSNIDDDAKLDDATILVVRSKTKVNKELVDRMRNLRCVISATHGMDHICLDYLS
jgi:phosphoglycerate dehydrogenase-like enzyme